MIQMTYNKWLTLLLALVMLVTSLPIMPSMAAGVVVTDSTYPRFSTLSADDKLIITGLASAGTPLKNIKGQYLALEIYKRYGLTVYQNANTCHENFGFGGTMLRNETIPNPDLADRDKRRPEYRYLGYNLNGDLVTNDEYLNDTGSVEASSLLTKKWIASSEMSKSWKGVNTLIADPMFTTPFQSTDMIGSENKDGYTAGDVLANAVGQAYSSAVLSKYQDRSLLGSPLTISSDGSIKLRHKVGSQYYYNSLVFKASRFNPTQTVTFFEDSACTKSITTFDIPADKTSATVYVKVSTNVDMTSIGMGEKEALFIAGVENFLGQDRSKVSLGFRTDLSSPSDVFGVSPLVLYKKDFTKTYKDVEVKSSGTIATKSVVIDVNKNVTGSGTLKVKALDPSELNPDFDILYGAVNVTDKSVQNDSETINKDFVFALKDQTYVPVGSSIKNWNWFIKNHSTGSYDYFGWTKDTSFTLKPADVAKYISNDTLTIKEVVVDSVDKLYNVEHTVAIVNKAPVLALPKAYIFPPGGVKAGEVTKIKGEGTTGNGSIITYAFNLSGNYKITNDQVKEKTGTFLAYNRTESSSLTVTDSAGKTATATEETVVDHPLTAIMKTNGVYKINRTIELDSTESTGTTYYPIDTVTWTIKPMDGQAVDSIKLHDGGSLVAGGKRVTGAKPKVDFKALGRYEVFMDVHSTCTFVGETSRTATKQAYGIITVGPDTPPTALLAVPTKAIRSIDTLQMSVFDIWDLSFSSDGDNIGKRTYYYRYDSDNDKSTADEVWETLYSGPDSKLTFRSPLVGLYEFKVEVEEANDSVSSPFWNALTDTLKANTDGQNLSEKTTEIINVAPITSVMADRKKIDLVIATDYEGSDLSALRTEIDLLTKDLYEQGLDVNTKIVSDKVKSGTYNAPIYKYARYGDVTYRVTKDVQQGVNKPAPYMQTDRIEWESRNQTENDYIPNYGETIPSTFSVKTGKNISGTNYTQIVTEVTLNTPEDPVKKNAIHQITEVFGDGYSSFQNIFDTINFTLRGYFERLNIIAFENADLYTLDLAKLQNYAYRDGADKKLIFVTKYSTSLATLSESFKDWAKTEGIEVGVITGGSLFDKFRLGSGDVKDFALNNTNLIFKTNMNKTYKIGDVTGSLADVYPVEYAYSSFNSSKFDIKITDSTAEKILNIQTTLNGSSFTKRYPTELSPITLNLTNSYDKYRWYTCNIYIKDGNLIVDGQQKMTGVQYILEVNAGLVYIAVGSSSSMVIVKNSIYDEMNFSTNNVTGYNAWLGYMNLSGVPLDNSVIQISSQFFHDPDVTSYSQSQYEGSYYDYVNLPTFKTSTGNVYTISNSGFSDETYIYDKQYKSRRSSTYGLINQGICDLANYSAQKYVNGTWRSRIQYFIKFTDKSITTSNGYLSSASSIMPAFTQRFNTPVNFKKIIFEDIDLTSMVMLGEDGTLYASGVNSGMRFGGTVSTPIIQSPAAIINPVKEPRQVVNASPISLQELLGINTQSRAYANFNAFVTDAEARYGQTEYTASLTRLLDDTLEAQVLYEDYEGDPLYASAVGIEHDPSVLENSLGLDANHGKTVQNWDGKLSKVGLYTIHPKVQDSPHEDDRYSDYRLWNKDDMTLQVLVHRKPVAKMKISMAAHATDGTKMVLTLRDNISYDADHQSEALRGITEIEWGFKANYDSAWQTVKGALGTQLTKDMIRGDTYNLSYRVKDKEGVWSDPVSMDIIAGTNFLFDAKMKAKDSTQSLNSFPQGGTVTLYDVWTSYELAHHLEVQLYDGSTPIGVKQTVTKGAGTITSEDFPEVFWKDIDFKLPSTGLDEKGYKVRITAVDTTTPSVTKYKEFPLTIVNNRPPTITFTSVTPSAPYEGDNITSVVKPSDPDGDATTVKYYLTEPGGMEKLIKTYTGCVSDANLTLQTITAAQAGQYLQRVVATDPSGASSEVTKLIWVNQMVITADFAPTDPMAGDALYFNIQTTGYVDKVEIIPDQSWITEDKRVSKGYKPAPYTAGLLSDQSYKALQIDMDESKLTDSVQRYRYQVWMSVSMSITLKGVRLRAPYDITIRAWKGTTYRDIKLTTDLEGNVLQTIKMGTPNK